MPDMRQTTPLPYSPSDALRYLPEGPIAIDHSRFSWVGIQHGKDATHGSLNIYDLTDHRNRSFDLPGRPGFAIPTQHADRFVLGCERSLGIFDLADQLWQPFCDGVDRDVDNTIINDGMAFRDNLIFGTKDLEFANKKAGLYLYRGTDQQLIRLRDDQICSNGKAIVTIDDQLTLIDIDSPTRRIVAYPIDITAGAIGTERILIDFADDDAVPDGMIVTPDQTGVIVSMFDPRPSEFGETRLYDRASGRLECVWQTPGSPQNTCPALVRHQGMIHLIITTAVEHMSEDDQKKCANAGRIFIGDTDLADDGKPLTSVYDESR